MKIFWMILMVSLVGCNSLKRITDGAESTPPAPVQASIQGVIQDSFQCVDISVLNSYKSVQVSLEGQVLNHWEYKEYDINPRQICFKNHVDEVDGKLIINGPVASVGDHFKIESL